MRRVWLGGVLLLLLTPGAIAWPADMISAPEGVSLRDSMLLAGTIDARADGATFGAPFADKLIFDAPATIKLCPDQRGEPQPAATCQGAFDETGARIYIHAGGVILRAPAGAPVTLHSVASAAALGGTNVTIGQLPVGAAVYAGGASVVASNGSTFLVRPLRSIASIEIRGDKGFNTFNGTAFTLYISNVTTARLEATGAFLGGDAPEVSLSRAGVRQAESGIVVDALYELIRGVQPPESADRRADLAEAFGPFQLVPALLDGAAAARTNFTLNGQPRGAFTFLRLEDARLSHADGNWTGSGNASYLVDDLVVARSPTASPRLPVILPGIFIVAAIAGRIFTTREGVPKRSRIGGQWLRIGGLVLLAFLAGAALRPLLGFSPLFDGAALTLRSRVQLALLVIAMVASAWLALGLPTESIARSLFAWRNRPRAILLPVTAGLLAAAVFLWLATSILLSFVARFVRL